MVIMPRTVLHPTATLKPASLVVLDRIYYLKPLEAMESHFLRFVVAVLNCRVTDYWFQKNYETSKVSRGYFDLNGDQIKSIPIPIADRTQHQRIADKVDSVIAAKREAVDADTSAIEHEIDKMIYELYHLTSEEIAVVEAAT